MGAATMLLSRLRGAVKSALYSGPARDRWQEPDRVLDVLDLDRGDRVVDLGAGGGYFTYKLARRVGPDGKVYAVDPDEDVSARIRARAERRGYAQIEVVLPDDGAPSLPERVDAVLTVNAFHHLPDDRVAYFRGLADLVKPGGRVAVIEALPKWYLFGHATEPEQIRSVLTDAGFDAVAVHDFLGRQSFTVFERPAG